MWKLAGYQWRSGSFQVLPQGNTVEDIVQDVITKTLEGRRKWDPSKGDLVPWLKDQLRSVIDALAKSASHRYEILLPEDEDDEGEPDNIEMHMVENGPFASAIPKDSESLVLEREREQAVKEKVNAAFQAVSDDPELEEVLEAMLDGYVKPRDIAKYLDVPVKDIYNRKRRLGRRALDIRSFQ